MDDVHTAARQGERPGEQPPSGRSGLLLARHGQTDDNLEPLRAQGFRDTPLNEVGLEQAHALAERVAAAYAVGSLWSSDLARAAVTAEVVGRRIGLQPRLDARLREGNRGDWEGRLFVDIARDEPDAYAGWMRGGAGFRFPGGESLQEHSDRVWEALEAIRSSGPLPALVVCHRGSIRAVMCRADPRGLDAFHEYDVPNTGVVEL
ncbi:MAG TPA: histidine phosphatase family protein [Solirubrobacteraceae bacterium]|jgi:broad specificity phosphatase PhoE|nr:histidine phosphatase family protein [Solirubrobacteraceae bacterium]